MHRIIDIISLSAKYLESHGVRQPRLNAELLLSDVLGKSRVELYVEHDKPVPEKELTSLRRLLKERAAHKPLQYLLGKSEFFSLPFLVKEGVFIPRPETEILVEEVVKHMGETAASGEFVVYDVGTGCGCIAVSVAHNIERCSVYASDISVEAVALAKRNAEKNDVEERVVVLRGDLFEPFVEAGAPKANVIACNPPYIAEEDWDSLPEEVRRFEPREALFGGKGGLDFLRRITESAESFLKSGGFLFLEIGAGQKEAVVGFLRERQKYIDITSRKDYNAIERVVSARLSPSAERGIEHGAQGL